MTAEQHIRAAMNELDYELGAAAQQFTCRLQQIVWELERQRKPRLFAVVNHYADAHHGLHVVGRDGGPEAA